MRKLTFFFMISIMVLSKSYAQDMEYFVAFCAKEVSRESYGGHAFIVIGKGQPLTCDIDNGDGEAFGLYASESDAGCKPDRWRAFMSYFVGPLPGCLFNDALTSYSNYFILRCSFDEYLSVYHEISKWKNMGFELGKQDCLAFVINVAKHFKNRIRIPERSGFSNFPNAFILEMKRINGF